MIFIYRCKCVCVIVVVVIIISKIEMCETVRFHCFTILSLIPFKVANKMKLFDCGPIWCSFYLCCCFFLFIFIFIFYFVLASFGLHVLSIFVFIFDVVFPLCLSLFCVQYTSVLLCWYGWVQWTEYTFQRQQTLALTSMVRCCLKLDELSSIKLCRVNRALHCERNRVALFQCG